MQAEHLLLSAWVPYLGVMSSVLQTMMVAALLGLAMPACRECVDHLVLRQTKGGDLSANKLVSSQSSARHSQFTLPDCSSLSIEGREGLMAQAPGEEGHLKEDIGQNKAPGFSVESIHVGSEPVAVHTNATPRIQTSTLRKLLYFQSEYLIDTCRSSFRHVDENSDGVLDFTELYSAVLLVYVKIVAFVPAAEPPSKIVVRKLFQKIDVDSSGSLDQGEFVELAKVLMEEISFRLVLEAAVALLIAPCVVTLLIEGLGALCSRYMQAEHLLLSAWVPYLGVLSSVLQTMVVAALLGLAMPACRECVDRVVIHYPCTKKSTNPRGRWPDKMV
jgi:hypothetical protein